MDFSFDAEQEVLRQQVRRFAQERIAPRRQEWDRERKSCLEMVKEFAERVPLGPRADHVTLGILAEEIAYADFNCAMPIVWSRLPFSIYQLPGLPEEERSQIRDAVLKGEKWIAFCFTEPSAGTDMAAIETTATRDGDAWRISGTKNSISWADADYYVVAARTAGMEQGVRGLTCFLVPRGTPGVSAPEVWDDLGTRGAARGTVHFHDARVPARYQLGETGKGYQLAAEFFDTNRAFIGLKCIGAAQASVDETCDYARKREVMGQPISRYQAISFSLAEAQTLLEAARCLCYKVLWKADRGERRTTEGAMCKWWVPEICFDIVHRCLLIHGHYGYAENLPFAQRLRDILGWQIGDGTAEACKLMIARALMGKASVG
jgi:cyclohexanecarboxyl-CoA dehydrogenase